MSLEKLDIYYERFELIRKRVDESARSKILRMRVLMDSIFRTLTEREEQIFPNLFNRLLFVGEQQSWPRPLLNELHGFRRMASRVLREQELQVNEDDAKRGFRAMLLLFGHLLKRDFLDGDDLADEKWAFGSPEPKNENRKSFLRMVVTNIGELQNDENDQSYFMLTGTAEGDEQAVEILVKDITIAEEGKIGIFPFLYLKKAVWSYCSLHWMALEERGANEYAVTQDSMVIIEPDYLLSASTLAECFDRNGMNPFRWFIGKLIPSDKSAAAFRGNIVNDLLDGIISDPERLVNDILMEVVAKNALTVARFGNDQMRAIFRAVKTIHGPNLQREAQRNAGKKISLEPSFFSARYGIQGRLDALIEDGQEPWRKEIFELKSGRVPFAGTWKNNEMQVVAYNLILKSVYGGRRKGSSSILYSQAEKEQLRNIVSTRRKERALLEARNKIISGLKSLAIGNASIIDRLYPEAVGDLPRFSMDAVSRFARAFGAARKVDRSWYRVHLSFLIRELWMSKVGSFHDGQREINGFSDLWRKALATKTDQFSVLPNLIVNEAASEAGRVAFRLPDDLVHNFRKGDLVIIYPKTGSEQRALQHQILKGHIKELHSEEVVVSFRNKLIGVEHFRAFKEWVGEHDFFESNFWSTIQYLLYFLEASVENRKLLLGELAPRKQEFPVLPCSVDPKQEAIIHEALRAKDYYLIQGPPGTGKTSTILVGIVDQVIKQTKRTICILAYTNRAVAEICAQLKKNEIEFLRLGGDSSSNPKHLSNLGKDITPDEISALIKKERIFVSTISGFLKKLDDLKQLIPLQDLIIDEASQVTEPQIMGLLALFEKFTLIGDHNQLPAVVAQNPHFCKIEQEDLSAIGFKDLRISLFERLYLSCEDHGWDHAIGLLEIHYRMHEQIAALINQHYENKLAVGTDRQQEVWEPKFEQDHANGNLLGQSRTIFLETEREVANKRHQQEAKICAQIVHFVVGQLGDGFSQKSIGIITPWRAQISEIKKAIGDEAISDQINIDTVERFQGSQNDLIIVSLAIYSPHQLELISSPNFSHSLDRKLLVALSRAREQVIFLGHYPILEMSKHYRQLVEMIQTSGHFIGAEKTASIFA